MLVKRSFIVLIVSVFVMLLALPSMAYAVYWGENADPNGELWQNNAYALTGIDKVCNANITHNAPDANDSAVDTIAWYLDKMCDVFDSGCVNRETKETHEDAIWGFVQQVLSAHPELVDQLKVDDGNAAKYGGSVAGLFGGNTGGNTVVGNSSGGTAVDTATGSNTGNSGATTTSPSTSSSSTQSRFHSTSTSQGSQSSAYASPSSGQSYSSPISGTSTTSQSSSFQQDPFQPLQAGTPGQPTDPNQPQPAPGDQPQPEASTGEAEGIAIADEMVITPLSPVPEEPVSMEQVTAIAAALATSDVVRTGVVALPILLVALFGAFILTGSEDYQPKTKLMKKIMEWRRKRKGEPEKGQPMFDERAYYDNGLSARGKNGRVNALGNGHRLQ